MYPPSMKQLKDLWHKRTEMKLSYYQKQGSAIRLNSRKDIEILIPGSPTSNPPTTLFLFMRTYLKCYF